MSRDTESSATGTTLISRTEKMQESFFIKTFCDPLRILMENKCILDHFNISDSFMIDFLSYYSFDQKLLETEIGKMIFMFIYLLTQGKSSGTKLNTFLNQQTASRK